MKKWKLGDICYYYTYDKLFKCVIVEIETKEKVKTNYSTEKHGSPSDPQYRYIYTGTKDGSYEIRRTFKIESTENTEDIFTITNENVLFSSPAAFKKSIKV